ncbi:MAG: glycosyltransferase family 4 protein [Faecousia sp.]
MLGHKRIPSREGGVEIVVEELSSRMVERGCDVTCYNRSGHHVSGRSFDVPKITSYKGVTLKSVPTVDQKGLAALTSSFFGAILCAFGRYDIVHFHAEGPCAMLWLPKLFGKKCIATIHGLDWQRAKWGGFASRYIKFGEKIAANYADTVIVLSEGVQKYFLHTYGRKTVRIPNGVNRPAIREAQLIQEKFGLSKDGYILFLGRLVPEKGVSYLIDAFREVQTDKKLVIAGGSSDTDAFLEALKELARDDERILFTGFVQGQLLEELFSNAYVYCLPSDLEGMPLSLLEAMSYGNCCVVSDIAECTEVVENKAVVFRKGNVEDLKVKLQTLCDQAELVQTYKSAAAEFICGKYSWDDVVDKTLEIYANEAAV